MDSQQASAKPKGGAEKKREAKRKALEQHAGKFQKIAKFFVSKPESTDTGPGCSISAIPKKEQVAADSTELDDIRVELEQTAVTEQIILEEEQKNDS